MLHYIIFSCTFSLQPNATKTLWITSVVGLFLGFFIYKTLATSLSALLLFLYFNFSLFYFFLIFLISELYLFLYFYYLFILGSNITHSIILALYLSFYKSIYLYQSIYNLWPQTRWPVSVLFIFRFPSQIRCGQWMYPWVAQKFLIGHVCISRYRPRQKYEWSQIAFHIFSSDPNNWNSNLNLTFDPSWKAKVSRDLPTEDQEPKPQ